MAKILLSYRRSDSAGITGRIFDRLVAHYGADSVFMDVDNIPFGTDFREHIRESLLTSDILLAIVGSHWLAAGSDGQSRIKQTTDPVRIEIETALQARVPIIPVLVDGTSMPQPHDLPETLERFCYLNAAEIESGRDFHHQLDRLIRSLDQIVAAKAAARVSVPKEQTAKIETSEPAEPGGEAIVASTVVSPEPAPKSLEAGHSRRNWLIGGGATLAIAAVALLAFFSSQRTTETRIEPSPAPAPAPAPTPSPPSPTPVGGTIRVGVAGPMTGANAAFGRQLKTAAEVARDDINASGGVLGRAIGFTIQDDQSDPKQGVAIADALAHDGISYVVGHFSSGVTIPASEVYRDSNILEITPASTNPQVTERGLWNVFRTCGRDDQQGVVAGNYIADRLKGKKVAILHNRTTYGQSFADGVKKTINAKGVREVLYEIVNAGERDFSVIVSKIRASGADLVVWGGLYTEGGPLVRQMRQAGVGATMIGGDGLALDEFATIGGTGVEGTLMTFGPDPRGRPEAKAAVAKFRSKNFEPEGYTLYTYAALQVIKFAAEAANSLDPRKIADVMHTGRKFPTVIGDISFDRKGDVTRLDYVMYVWKKDASGKMTYTEIDQ
jgi:branched-chain amino acid transport system substrate-binding protein